MGHHPSIVCPIDFSDTSRTALRHAAVIADHFGARLLAMTVDDPLLANVAAETGAVPSLVEETGRELRRLIAETLADLPPGPRTLAVRVVVGRPATEILRLARDERADLIVMSSHGRGGLSKRFFGSTTERVLRHTDIPVLVTPKDAAPFASLSELGRRLGRIIVPADLTSDATQQLRVAGGIASALALPLVVAHVLEPVFIPPAVRMAVPGADMQRRANAEELLQQLVAGSTVPAGTESIVLSGDPSEEIVKLAETRGAGLIVMGLHSAGLLGPHMGTVTYRVLCLTHALVLALPPAPALARDVLGATAALVRE
jgi:nucleotide-binding universal stress UspA family protein